MSWLTEPDEDWDPVDDEPPRSRLRLVALLLGGWLAVSLLVLVGLLAFGGHSRSQHQASGSRSTPPVSVSTPTAKPTDILPAGWVRQAGDDQTDCAAHSYGQVQTFFGKTPCSSVHRLLATTTQGGRTVVIASNEVTFDTTAQAARYLALVNSDGTGNISDLLREGVGFPGAPSKLPAAAFASRQSGSQVFVAEAAYITGSSGTSDPALKAIAEKGITPS
ncbi:MAG TPA: hypothetical protein VH298_03045 [Jatrophihabitans sp.]|nr:hypothetical protein [Jatrophihabitans sp.]